ncbi:MAG TPA: hypothetical protein PK665_15150, partial [Ignavibacteriaceae bacterium]|nr:hypothetical protein [Ignavibacteriaceae bacterium]
YRYYIKAQDIIGRKSTSPLNAPTNLYSFEAATDLIPPVITHTAINNTAKQKWPLDVTANVTDNLGVQLVQCEFRVNGGAINIFPMVVTEGNNYKGTFTGFVNIGDVIEYKIKATDNSINYNVTYSPSSGYYSFNIIPAKGIVLVVDDDVSLEERISWDKGGTENNSQIPLGASASLFTTTLTNSGYVADQVSFSGLNINSLNDYDLVILSAGVKESSIFSDASKRNALVNYTLNGGKILVEGGEVGYIYRKSGTLTDLDPPFRRNVLNDSAWVSDRSGASLQIATATHPLFTTPNLITGPISVNNGGSSGYGARDEVTLLNKSGVIRIANWSGGTSANAGIIVYNPNNDTAICRNIYFTFAVSQIANQTIAANLIENSVEYLMRDKILQTKTLTLTAIIEGLWDGFSMVNDTVTVEIRNTSLPYSLVESKEVVLSFSGTASVELTAVKNSTPYYLVVKHRNSIETWSAAGQQFIYGYLNYDFTTSASKAYGNNLVLKGGKYCIYSGDVNNDGFVNSVDLNLIFNDNLIGAQGYRNTDLTGDQFTEINDLIIAFINGLHSVQRIQPYGFVELSE